MKGFLTYTIEGNDNPKSNYFTRKLRLDSEGGLMLGKRYKLHEKTPVEITADMQMIGLNEKFIELFRHHHKARGHEARALVERLHLIFKITTKQELKLFAKEIEPYQQEVEAYLSNNLEGKYIRSFSDLPKVHQDILVDFAYAGHFDKKIRNVFLVALMRCEREKNLRPLNDLICDIKLWQEFGFCMDRIKQRIIYLNESERLQVEQDSDKNFGIPPDTISNFIMAKPNDYLVNGLKVDHQARELFLILKQNIATDRNEEKILEGIDFGDLVLCLRILYDDSIKNKFFGVSHMLNIDNPINSIHAFNKVTYPDVFENRNIIRGTKLEQDLKELVDVVHDLKYGRLMKGDLWSTDGSNFQKIPSELQALGFPWLDGYQGLKPGNKHSRSGSCERQVKVSLKYASQHPSLSVIRQRNDLHFLRSLIRKNSHKISPSPPKITSQTSLSCQRSVSVQKQRKLVTFCTNDQETERPESDARESPGLNVSRRKDYLPVAALVANATEFNGDSYYESQKRSIRSELFAKSFERKFSGREKDLSRTSNGQRNSFNGKSFFNLPHDTFVFGSLEREEFTLMDKVNRLWIKPEEVSVVDCDLNRQNEYFLVTGAKIKMEAKKVKKLESMAFDDIPLTSTSNPNVEFANQYTQACGKLSKYFRCMQRLDQIVKAWALAQRIYLNKFPLDLNILLAFLDRHQGKSFYEQDLLKNYQVENKGLSHRRTQSTGKTTKYDSNFGNSREAGSDGSLGFWSNSKPQERNSLDEEAKAFQSLKVRQEGGIEVTLVGVMIDFGEEILTKGRIIQGSGGFQEDKYDVVYKVLEDKNMENKAMSIRYVNKVEKESFSIKFPLLKTESCSVCQKLLNFMEAYSRVGDKTYCRLHHPYSCQKCYDLIKDNGMLQIGGKFYHKECMICNLCGKPLDANKTYMGDNLIHAKCSGLQYFSLTKRTKQEKIRKKERDLAKMFSGASKPTKLLF